MIKSLGFECLASFLGHHHGSRCTVFRLREMSLDLPKARENLTI